MKIKVPVLVKDPSTPLMKGVEQTEPFVAEDEDEDICLDGPVTRRIAVLDFDPASRALVPGARFVAPPQPDGVGRYELPRGESLYDPAFMQVSTFGSMRKTIAMFEEPDTLGRRIAWAFPVEQLLVVPRAGEWANAFYERESHSLQFFYFTPESSGRPVYTCHSQDIIAHETAHAVIDGVAPDLYHASTPQSLAIHESLADLATLINAFRRRRLAARVLEHMGGSIEQPTAFTAVAGQFGAALHLQQHGLRNLSNSRTMADTNRSEPHALSEVLSGALYSMMMHIYNELRGTQPERLGKTQFADDA